MFWWHKRYWGNEYSTGTRWCSQWCSEKTICSKTEGPAETLPSEVPPEEHLSKDCWRPTFRKRLFTHTASVCGFLTVLWCRGNHYKCQNVPRKLLYYMAVPSLLYKVPAASEKLRNYSRRRHDQDIILKSNNKQNKRAKEQLLSNYSTLKPLKAATMSTIIYRCVLVFLLNLSIFIQVWLLIFILPYNDKDIPFFCILYVFIYIL